MKKILVILSAILLSACANYDDIRKEDSYMAYNSLNNSSNIIFIHRTYPYYYGYDHKHNHINPDDNCHQPKPPHQEKTRNELFKPFFKSR